MNVHRSISSVLIALGCLAFESSAFAQNSGPVSADELMTKLLASIQAKDKPALQQLTVTEAEFKKYVWPNLPAVVRGSQSSEAKFYKMYSTSSDAALDTLLQQHGGQNLKFVKASFGSEAKHKGYRILPNAVVTASAGDGEDKTLRLASSVIEHDGIWKVASYFVSPTADPAKK